MDLQIQILTKFQLSLVSFFDELINIFPNEQEFIILRILVKDQIPSIQIMSYFETILEDEKIMLSIKTRDDQFFLQNVLFSKFNKSDIFKNIWLNKLDEDDKKMFWNWIDSFFKIASNYVNAKKSVQLI
jgi:hypothetical protein